MRRLFPEPGEAVDPETAYSDLPAPQGRPGVRLNMVASIDGAIAVDGVSGGLGGDADRRVFMALRSLCDVVLVAAGTIRAEAYGPSRLTGALVACRQARGQAPTPRIAVVSRSLELDWDSPFFTGAPAHARPLILTCAAADPAGVRRAEAVADVVVAGDEAVDLRAALAALGRGGASAVLAEGGPRLNGALAAAGLLDELCLTVSPLLVGGAARRILDGPALGAGSPMRIHAIHEDEGFLFLRYRADAA